MKHIKEYNISRIEELSEYLQEIFDKFHIPEYKGDYDSWVTKDEIEINWVIKKFSDEYIIICCCDHESVRDENIFAKSVLEEIIKIKPILERRLRQSITIKLLSNYYIKISI